MHTANTGEPWKQHSEKSPLIMDDVTPWTQDMNTQDRTTLVAEVRVVVIRV